jgi:hypothetical protein
MVEIRHKDTGDVLLRVEADTLERANLDGANLESADLAGLTLRGARLHGANLSCAQLEGATLADADLRGAELFEANLRGAKMGGTTLSGANLWSADLEGAVLVSGSLAGATMIQANLRRTVLSYTSLAGASLADARLEGAVLRGANLRGTDLTRADLRGADLCVRKIGEWSSAHFSVLAGSIYDGVTRWPEVFNPQQYGALSVTMSEEEFEAAFLRALSQSFGQRVLGDDRLVVISHGKRALCRRPGTPEEEAPWTPGSNVLSQFPEGRFRDLCLQRLQHLCGPQPWPCLVLERPGDEIVVRDS